MFNTRTAIAVTGLGVSAGGDNPETLWENAAAGRSPAVWFGDTRVRARPTVPACLVKQITDTGLTMRRSHKMDRCVQLALAAAGQALADAHLATPLANARRVGIVTGTSRGPAGKIAEMVAAGSQQEAARGDFAPTLTANTSFGGLSGALAMATGARGPSFTTSATCASGAFAIAQAAQQIVLGTADIMLAGGTEAPFVHPFVPQLMSTGILGTNADPRLACRPFHVERNGTVLGEGAAFLVLESLASARRRGVPVHALLAGWGFAAEPCDPTCCPRDGEGLVQVMSQALAMAELDVGEIDYINAHGTATRLNDPLEVLALQRLWGERLAHVPISSTKPITGHCLGAVAALEAVIAVHALKRQSVPPTANCTQRDPQCPIDAVPGVARDARLQVVMSNSLGFWGYHASLIFKEAS
jgi:3-oxoacyl-(acyl-carrier-protein) synthase